MIEIKHFSSKFLISIVPFTDHFPATVRCCFYPGIVVFPKTKFSIAHFIHKEEREKGGQGREVQGRRKRLEMVASVLFVGPTYSKCKGNVHLVNTKKIFGAGGWGSLKNVTGRLVA